jgi:hypothetical protein
MEGGAAAEGEATHERRLCSRRLGGGHQEGGDRDGRKEIGDLGRTKLAWTDNDENTSVRGAASSLLKVSKLNMPCGS